MRNFCVYNKVSVRLYSTVLRGKKISIKIFPTTYVQIWQLSVHSYNINSPTGKNTTGTATVAQIKRDSVKLIYMPSLGALLKTIPMAADEILYR